MVTLLDISNLISSDPCLEFICASNINLYDSPQLNRLATQAVPGRQLRITSSMSELSSEPAIQVCLREDDYSGWISVEDLDLLNKAEKLYQARLIKEIEIHNRLPQVIEFAQRAMHQPNYYLWGGTVGPNYDCSGLMQAAFLSVGIWIPRDAYQQEAFTQTISIGQAEPGDLIFFGSSERITHVGLYLGDRHYLHSSGKEIGRNGIGIDILSESGDLVSQNYFKQYKSAGRIIESFVA